MRCGCDMEVCMIHEECQNRHIHQNVELYYVLTGRMSITIDKQNYKLQKESLILVNANVPHELEIHGKSLAAVFKVSHNFITDLTKNPLIGFECYSGKNHAGPMEDLKGLFKNMLVYHMNSGCLERVKEYGYYYEILWHLLKYYSTWDMMQDDSSDLSRLEEILGYIQMNYSRQIGLQDLADRFYLSVPYLSKYIKERLGMGFTDYLNEVRLQHAVDGLVNTDHSVTRIAFDNGFPNLTSFNRVFRKNYFMTPSVYKKSIDEKHVKEKPADTSTKSAELLREYFEKNPIMDAGQGRYILAEADCGQTEAYCKNWMRVLNLGAAEDLQQFNIQEHLLSLKKGLNYQYGRIWSLFCKENCIDINADKAFNFSKLDQILDFMLNNNITPFLDFGLKPKVITSNVSDRIVEQVRAGKFSGLDQYSRLIREFIRHCVRRYGVEEVENWKFEVWWNRQDLDQTSMPRGWYDIFCIVCQCIKAYAPGARVGGFGFNIYDSNAAVENFLKSLDGQSIRPDFISVYLYPYNAVEDMRYGNDVLVSDEDFIEKELNQLRKLLKNYGLSEDMLYITEWNMSISSRNYLHDSCYKAAYIVKNVIASIGKTACMAYWGNTDRIAEYFDSVNCLNGAPGLLSKDGIRKPSYFAFEFLNRLGGNLLAKADHYIITSTNHDSYFIVSHNFQNVGIDYYLQNGENIALQQSSHFFGKNNLCIDVKIGHAKPGKYSLRKYYVNQDAGSILDEWMRIGDIEVLDREEMEYLSSISIPHLKSETLQGENGVLRFKTELKANEIQLIHLAFIVD